MMLLSQTSSSTACTRGRVAQAPTALPAGAAMPHRPCASQPCLEHRGFQAIPSQASVISRRKVVARFEGSADAPQSSKVAEDEATVEEIMQPHPTVLTADMTCHDAARLLLKNDISSAPVVDGSGKLVGVLSESDLLWKSAGPLDHTIIPPVFVGAFDLLISLRDNNAVKAELDKILAQTVGQAMTKEPKTVMLSTSLSKAARTLLQAKVNLLPVVDDQNKVVGVLTQHDILRGMVAEQDL